MHRSRMLLVPAMAAWGLAVSAGLLGLHAYEATPGRPGVPRPRWPEGGGIRPVPGRANLVLFAHPRCPCSRASLEELARILDGRGDEVAAHVVFFRPGRPADPWPTSPLRDRAEAIPGVRVLDDPDGAEAARFGAETSGHVALFDPSGVLLFSGGITPARGRVGDGPGRVEVLRRLDGGASRRATAPVFGCPILEGSRPAAGRAIR